MHCKINIFAWTVVAALMLPGCDLLKKAASGGKISQRDLVNAADKEVKADARNKKKVADLQEDLHEDLKEIETMRMNGRFSSSDYREKRLHKNLTKLQKLDAKNPMLASTPKKLEELKATYTQDVYNRKALAGKCAKALDDAKQARMDENWRSVDSRLTKYAQCRRKLKDVGVDESVVAGLDTKAIAEYDAYAEYMIVKIEEYRKAQKFRYASGFETTLEDNVLRYYKEISPSSGKPKTYSSRVGKLRKRFRDPKEVEAEKQQAAFDAWRGQVAKSFEVEWAKVQSAENAARPSFDAGVKALDASDYKTATAKLLEARQQLFTAAYPSAVALEAAYKNGSLEKGLSYEIASALARTYFEQGDKANLYPELAIIKNGRKWLEKDKEIQVRLFDILADTKGKMTPKPTDAVKRYAGRYSTVGKELKSVKEVAHAQRGESYNMLGVAVETISHRMAGSSTAESAGKVVYMEAPVSLVKGKSLRFDFRSEYQVPVKCRNTKEVSNVNLYTGRVSYKQKCTYKKVKTGYTMVVPAPKGVKVKKGDIVAFYAAVGKRLGKFDVSLTKPGYVRVAPGGQTQWFLGSKVK